jgi:A/G-specific adenine glycosylase
MQWFARTLLQWFDKHGRKNLPWQKSINPYRVWVSEIMLQQTQVATVIPYYQKFIHRFSSIASLATASEDEILHYWTGLGYYSRARNLYKTAKIIHSQLHDKFPNTVEELQKLPGIGRSTAGAILAFTGKQATPILEGNVKRVLTRFYAIEGWPGKSEVQENLWKIAASNTPQVRTADYTQAIMDLGATICIRGNPLCHLCPLQKKCRAYLLGKQKAFPTKNPHKKILPVRKIQWMVLQNYDGAVLLEKRSAHGVWASLWCFPEAPANNEEVTTWCLLRGLTIKQMQIWETFRHTFSHFHLDITPIHITVNKRQHKIMESERLVWYKTQQEPIGGFASPVKKLLAELYEQKNLLSKA